MLEPAIGNDKDMRGVDRVAIVKPAAGAFIATVASSLTSRQERSCFLAFVFEENICGNLATA